MLVGRLSSLFNGLDKHSQELLRGTSVALVLRVLAAGFSFLLSVALARILGPDGAGLYFLAYGVITIAGVGCRLGLGDSLVRFTSVGMATEDGPVLGGLALRALLLGGGASALVSGSLFVASPWLASRLFDDPRLTTPMRIMVLSLVPFVTLTLLGSLLRGRKRIAQSLAVMATLPPLITLVGVLILGPGYGPEGATVAYVVATVLTLGIALGWWRKASPNRSADGRPLSLRELFASSVPLFWHSLFKMVIDRSPVLFLGLFATAEEVGILEVANRTALLVSFVLLAVNNIAGPKFAELYILGEIATLARTARRAAMLSAGVALPLVVVFVSFPELVMSLFGERFVAGASLLVILSLGQLINAGTGSVAVVLIMSGNERAMRNVTFGSLLFSVALYLTFIPLWGMHGAAAACALTVGVQNLAAVFAVRRALGIWTLPRPHFKSRA